MSKEKKNQSTAKVSMKIENILEININNDNYATLSETIMKAIVDHKGTLNVVGKVIVFTVQNS